MAHKYRDKSLHDKVLVKKNAFLGLKLRVVQLGVVQLFSYGLGRVGSC